MTWVLVALAVTLVVGAAAIIMIFDRGRSALEVAEEYLQHIADGDVEASFELIDSSESEPMFDSDPTLLTEEVLGSAIERISDVEVEYSPGFSDAGSSTVVDVTYTLAGETYSGMLRLARDEGGWFDPGGWLVRGPFTAVWPMGTRDASFLLGDVEIVSAADAELLRGYELFPAVYPISAVDATFFDTDRDELVVATVGLSEAEAVEVRPNAHFESELHSEAEAFLTGCAAQTTWRPEGCPFAAPIEARAAAVAWDVGSPSVYLLVDETMFTAEVRIRATFTPEGATEPTVWEDLISFTGEVEIDGSTLSISYG